MSRSLVLLLSFSALAFGSAVKSKSGSESIDGSCSTPGTKYLGDRRNCTVYYECHDGEPVAKICPDKTRFNFSKKKCLSNDFNYCPRAIIPKNVEGECPKTEGSNPIYLADSEKCDVFYECTSNGEAKQHQCPETTHWNQEQKVCDHPDNVKCTKEGDSNFKRARRWISQFLHKFFK